MDEILARYVDRGSWGYVRVRLRDGRIIPEHRYVMEKSLGRVLLKSEHVHHLDEDKHNNDLANLELLTKSDHASLHAKPAPEVLLVCPSCGKEFTRKARYVRMKRKLKQRYFLCSRSCRMPKGSPPGGADPCKIGAMGSTPILSTKQEVVGSIPPDSTLRV